MNTDVKLSTKFLTTQNAHQIGLLATFSAERPARRAPINLALVLDRSGSMEGAPLAAARDAAARFTEFLGPEDRLAVVVFDDDVHTIFGPATADNTLAREAIACVHSGGSTNLSGGWLQGRAHVESGLVQGTNRVVLFTDGMANRGIVDIPRLVELARGAASQHVTTSCIGFGPSFNEELLDAMGKSGGGNYWYVESVDRMGDIFAEEIEGLVALAAQNLTVEIRPTHLRVAGVSFLQQWPVSRTPEGGWLVSLGDLYATAPKSFGTRLHVEEVETLGDAQVAELRVSADIIGAAAVEHRTITRPIVASLDGQDHIEPTVERTFVRFEGARAREDAVARADRGDFDGAARVLESAADTLRPYDADRSVALEIADLVAESQRLAERRWEAADRKYHLARHDAVLESKQGYLNKMSRRRPVKDTTQP